MIFTGDFNHDGKPDLITQNPNGGNISILLNQWSGHLSLAEQNLYIKIDTAQPVYLDIWANTSGTGTPSISLPLKFVTSISQTAVVGSETITADFSNGNIVPSAGLSITGFGNSSTNTLTVVGMTGTDILEGTTNAITLNGHIINYTSIGSVLFKPNTINEALTIAGGSISLAGSNTATVTEDLFLSVSISAGATLNVASSPIPASRLLVRLATLNLAGTSGNWTSTLNMTDNDLDIYNGNFAIIQDEVKQGITGAYGIISTTVKSNTARTSILAAIINNDSSVPIFSGTHLFDNISPASYDALIKYTYYGDANLDGKVDASDYSRIDSGFLTAATGWYNGDFNYDGVVNGSDYTLIDNAFNRQGASLAAEVVSASKPSKIISSVARPTRVFSSGQSISNQSWTTSPANIATQIFSDASDDTVTKRLKFSKQQILR